MKFAKEFLQDEGGETVEDRITGVGRWSIRHRRVFRHEGKLYVTAYQTAATESQDERPYEYDPDEIECPEVFPQPSIVYLPAEKA